MSVRMFGCRKFRRIIHEREDRTLFAGEDRFLEKHRVVCPDCRSMEATSTMALNMLRAATLEPVDPPAFEERVIRRWRVQSVRESIGYWSPALAGAGIACLAIFAAMALIGRPSQLQQANVPGGEARVYDSHRTYPLLELRGSNSFVR